ncbi:hypothetical protein L1077_06915 [Pseudoalteromonas luteoviolacea]|uniref:sensor histidine kinase n=1 Tax=Pseudoalteromonas luteoviolacea TaxID=43657 RepID=UPI001F3E332E|nr:hypothetical protein [Pseudoalteromonas luteoviolacea]MCF6439153.1 hypothetical protein [Pseudoalteromonas luteoviolacea]
MMNKPQSFGRYFILRVGAFFLVFIVIWIQVATWVYHFAWDDTTEHYLYQDLALAHSGQLTLPLMTQEKFIGFLDDMPLEYQAVLNIDDIEFEHTFLLSSVNGDMYVLKSEDTEGRSLFIIHFFSHQDSPSLVPIFIVLSSFMLIPLGLLVWRVWRAMSRDLNRVTRSLETDEVPSARFIEMSELQSTVKMARFAQRHAQKQERLFSAFLSHEVRTPLTHIHHSMSRLQQIDEIPLAALDVLDELESGQQALTDIADAVLLLSQPNKAKLERHALQPLLMRWQTKWREHGLSIELEDDHLVGKQAIEPKLFELFLIQVAKNALQHGDGALRLRCDEGGLVFDNTIKAEPTHSGHGLGSQMMSQVCDCFGWTLNVHIDSKYTLSINWEPTNTELG